MSAMLIEDVPGSADVWYTSDIGDLHNGNVTALRTCDVGVEVESTDVVSIHVSVEGKTDGTAARGYWLTDDSSRVIG